MSSPSVGPISDTTRRYHAAITQSQWAGISLLNNSKELKDCERIVKQIAKTNDLIRKKYRTKTGKIEEDTALEKHFKPIVEPLKDCFRLSRTPLMNLNQLRKKSTL
ncbi:hypothetical protein G5I_11565 [Acromyrmex echinatior]|uniref:Uncharacterized protein n=1 Tax=Acromyrmex echinatior TaxID=103372 RepID=F4WZY7_ACREC|nr:hypothetical protein G5I_11565 [Acromyrmex echinatior]